MTIKILRCRRPQSLVLFPYSCIGVFRAFDDTIRRAPIVIIEMISYLRCGRVWEIMSAQGLRLFHIFSLMLCVLLSTPQCTPPPTYMIWPQIEQFVNGSTIYLFNTGPNSSFLASMTCTPSSSASSKRPWFQNINARLPPILIGMSGCSSPSTLILVSMTCTSKSLGWPWLRYIDARLTMPARVVRCVSPEIFSFCAFNRSFIIAAWWCEPALN